MKLNNAIATANQQRRLGLILYVIPNFPDPTTYEQTLSFLLENEYVSIIELTQPITEGFSEHANETIRRAHLKAAQYKLDLRKIQYGKATLFVLYESTAKKYGFSGFLKTIEGVFDSLILEWSEKDESAYAAEANKFNIELVQCIGPWMDQLRIEEILKNSISNGLVYLMSAPMTGGQLFTEKEISKCLRTAKSCRPDIKIAAGFGIGKAEDINSLKKIKELDAIIIGTQFLKIMERGFESVEEYLTEIFKALELT